MSEQSVKLSLPYIQPAQAQKHVTHNSALERLDVLVQPNVLSHSEQIPPVSPAEGDSYIVPSGAQGAWAGHVHEVTWYQNGNWTFLPPGLGWMIYVADLAQPLWWNGSAWGAVGWSDLPGVGIGTGPDAGNPLAVAAPASLFSHAGAGHQVKVNKAAAAETASLLFQSDWQGHAEMGLVGDQHFVIKVSADGGTWAEALRFDPTSGHTSGAAVQSDPMDDTMGRLLSMGAFGLGTRLRSVQVEVANDSAVQVPLVSAGGIVSVSAQADRSHSALVVYDQTSAPRMDGIWQGTHCVLDSSGAVLSGTTGGAEKTTLSILAVGGLQIENRSGQSQNYHVTCL